MTEKEQIQYLANIYYLARADNKFEVEEDYVLLDIANGIGAGYLQTRKALDAAMCENFKLKLPDRFSIQIRNLEDMFLLAYYDGRLEEVEKKIIVSFAKQLGIAQKQFDIIKSQAKERLAQIKTAQQPH